MIDTPHIADLPARPTAFIHVTCTREEIQHVMGQGVRDLMDAVAAQGVRDLMDAVAAQGASPAGPWFTHHRRRPTDTFDFEISVPLATPIGPHGRMQPGEWPAMRVARTVHRGRYEDLAGAWGEFLQWIEGEGLTPTGELWECYLTGPETGSDPTAWRTELNQPLQD